MVQRGLHLTSNYDISTTVNVLFVVEYYDTAEKNVIIIVRVTMPRYILFVIVEQGGT
jgi:hypothetical protein